MAAAQAMAELRSSPRGLPAARLSRDDRNELLKPPSPSPLRILATRRAGNSIYYRIVDACVPALLERGWCLLDTTQTPPSPATDSR
jgi:hypothetical protein